MRAAGWLLRVVCGVPQIPGGWAAQRYGGRIVLLACFLLWSSVSLMTPTDARYTRPIVLARVGVGVAQGFLIPAVHTVLSQVSAAHWTAVYVGAAHTQLDSAAGNAVSSAAEGVLGPATAIPLTLAPAVAASLRCHT
jgi:ACS family sodium-dependent inorganic phosphate cotransporter